MEVRQKVSPRVDLALGLAGIGVFLAAWAGATYGGLVKPLFLPTPTYILEGLAAFNKSGWLVPAILNSTKRVLLSLLLVVAVGVPFGALMGSFSHFDAVFRKLINGGKSIPTTGLAGLIVLWFSIEERAKIIFLFLGAIFYMILLVRAAFQSVREDYVRVAEDIGATPMQVVSKILFPAALPQIWEAIAVCSGIMWTYIVLAEFINSNEEQIGLGYLLSVGSRTQDSGKVFGTLILIALISAATDWLLKSIQKRFFPW
ncbi:MAG: ABC transporter permease subunit [Armatimonadetes bacterium]|nr:ABC transporter permease subunit [Armatimonadota bacterium]